MSSTFICNKCSNNNYEQFSQTQVRCLNCGTVSEYDSGYRVTPEFDLSKDDALLNIEPKVLFSVAPISKRIANYVIDILSASFVIFFIGTLLKIEISTPKGEITDSGLIIMMITIPVYYFILEFSFGKTIGKYFTKTKVVSVDGKKPTLFQCFFRSIFRLLPFEQFSGLFMKGVFWHDLLPKTLVIED
ncbi:MAG TPA: RDD family protein [Chitinophagales bacterium]|jgi:uncharacterized RDD family membrane protein YckC|nr:RDD family protein [Chitinophagales bacterium]